jgi:hypothetical protein
MFELAPCAPAKKWLPSGLQTIWPGLTWRVTAGAGPASAGILGSGEVTVASAGTAASMPTASVLSVSAARPIGEAYRLAGAGACGCA